MGLSQTLCICKRYLEEELHSYQKIRILAKIFIKEEYNTTAKV
jgi:hypothetical protein